MAKSKYESHVAPFLDKIALWAEKGATQTEIAKKLKMGVSTFKKYLALGEKGEKPYVDLVDCFRRACEIPDDEVEAAMFKRATGITYDEEVYEPRWDEHTEQMVEVCVKRTRKYIPPDPTSAMFWLTNRRADKWRYKPQEGDSGDKDDERGVVMIPEVKGNG